MKGTAVIFFCIICLTSSLVYADISMYKRYVNDETGNDSWDGLRPVWDGTHGPKKTIQAGIDICPDNSTVTVAPGTYSGDGNRDLEFRLKKLTLISERGPDETVIDCEGSYSEPHRGVIFRVGHTSDSIIDGFTITNGEHINGGGIVIYNGEPVVRNCVFTNNVAYDYHGAAIWCQSNGDATIENCVMTGNIAYKHGGGICCSASNPKIINCLIYSNISYQHGGGISCRNGAQPEIINCTIAGNAAEEIWGGGIFCDGGAAPTMTNCILWNNTGVGSQIALREDSSLLIQYCDVQGGRADAYVDSGCTLNWGTGNLVSYPMFMDSEAGDYHLAPASPCIDKGTSSGAPSLDLDGKIRWDALWTSDDASIVDVGAFEFHIQYVYVNDTLGDDSYDGLTQQWDETHGPKKTIQAGITAASDGMTVYVAPGVYKGDGNRDLEFLLKKVTLESERGPSVTIIDCEGTAEEWHRGVIFRVGHTSDTTIDGFTIRNGEHQNGGAIVVYGSCPIIRNCIFMYNVANNYHGGAIWCQSGSPATIENCIMTKNTAYKQGGGVCFSDSDATIANCLIYDNLSHDSGGGISCLHGAQPSIMNCTVADNTGRDFWGGAIFCDWEASPTMTNCILWGNTGIGNQIALRGGSGLTISYCDVQGGQADAYILDTSVLTWGNGNIDENPAFLDPVEADYHLAELSPCIDRATDVGAPALDFEGKKRLDAGWVENNPSIVDMGALEYVMPFIYVNDQFGDDSYDGWAEEWNGTHGPKKTIQAAIDAALEGDTVLVAPGTYGGDGNRDLEFRLKKITLLSKTGPIDTVIDCGSSPSEFHRGVIFRVGHTSDTIIDGFTITNGRYDNGAGIVVYNGSPVIRNCIFTNNVATDYHGGAIWCQAQGDATIEHCVMTGNTAFKQGGGFCCTASNPTLANCLIYGNFSSDSGGGISCLSGAKPYIINCTVANNTADDYWGGGIFCDWEAAPTVANCILWGNTGAGDQIGLRGESMLTISFCDVEGGEAGAYVDYDSVLNWSSGNIDEEPLFATGPDGDFYLSQTAAGQNETSPCVDAGMDTLTNVDLYDFTTRIDGAPDTGDLDMGYHTPYNLRITQLHRNLDNSVTVCWNAREGVQYTLESSIDMVTWEPHDVGETDTYTDAHTSGECKYYRVTAN